MPARNDLRALALLLLAGLAGCGPLLDTSGRDRLDQGLWDPAVVSAQDGIYVRLPAARSLARILPDGSWELVDLEGAEPLSLQLGPDAAQVFVFSQLPTCESDDPHIEAIEDCPADELSYRHELQVVEDGQLGLVVELPSHFNALAFSPVEGLAEGIHPTAVAYADLDAGDVEVEGLANLTEVLFIDLQSGETQRMNVGFAADAVLFTEAGDKAVVLSRNQVEVVDLSTSPYEPLVTYHLTLDPDRSIDPLGAAFTPDGEYLLISVQGSGDLYALDLERESINIVDLAGPPADMAVDQEADRTVLVYANQPRVDVLEHESFSVETEELDLPCTEIAELDDGRVLLYDDRQGSHDLYLLDPLSMESEELVVPNPVDSLTLAPGHRAVAQLSPDTGRSDGFYDRLWGLSILDLDGGDAIDLALESRPVGLAIAGGEEDPYALLLLDDYDSLLQLSLADGSYEEVPLVAPPTGLGSLPGGGFYITHDSALGLVTFLDPESGEQVVVAGFAAAGILDDPDERPLPDSSSSPAD